MAVPLLQPVHQGFNPTRQDVQVALRILRGLRLEAKPGRTMPDRLPGELALAILAHSEYNPRAVSSRAEVLEYHADDFWEPGPTASVAALYLTTRALPRHFRRASSVTVQMRGADQGWATFGGDGTYENSHTWFEACILRALPGTPGQDGTVGSGGVQQQQQQQQQQPPLEVRIPGTFRSPEDANQELEQLGWRMVEHGGRDTWLVHHNITASEDWRDYRVDWSADTPTEIEVPGAVGDGEGFLSALMPGDKIALWARAEQQAWVIRVAEAAIEIVYEVWI